MSFADARARDAAHIYSRTNSEFGVEVKFWNKDLDPATDDATTTTRGTRFEQPSDRQENSDGQSAMRSVSVSVTKAAVSAIDEEGMMLVNGLMFAIEHVSDADDITWSVKGTAEEQYAHGDASRAYGG